jgi:hypothetical protein
MEPEPSAFAINEQTTGSYTAILVGNDGVTPLPGGTLLTLLATLYVIKQDGTTAIVNGRNAQPVLNTNNFTVSAAGLLTWTIQIGDTSMVENIPFERHILLLAWTWAGGAGKHETVLVVKNLRLVI